MKSTALLLPALILILLTTSTKSTQLEEVAIMLGRAGQAATAAISRKDTEAASSPDSHTHAEGFDAMLRVIHLVDEYHAHQRMYASLVAYAGMMDAAGGGPSGSDSPSHDSKWLRDGHVVLCGLFAHTQSTESSPTLNSFVDDVYGCSRSPMGMGIEGTAWSALRTQLGGLVAKVRQEVEEMEARLSSTVPQTLLAHPWTMTALYPWLRPSELFAAGVMANARGDYDLVTFFMEAHEAKVSQQIHSALAPLSHHPDATPPGLSTLLQNSPGNARLVSAPIGFFVREQYNYLQFAYAQRGQIKAAIAAADAYLVFDPAFAPILENVKILKDMYAQDPNVVGDVIPDRVDPLLSYILNARNGGGEEEEGMMSTKAASQLRDCQSSLKDSNSEVLNLELELRKASRLADGLYVRVDEMARVQAGCSSPSPDAECPPFSEPLPGLERDASSLSYHEFYTNFSLRHTPVLIKGGADVMTTTEWDLDHLDAVCGDKMVTPGRYAEDGAGWAALSFDSEIPLSQYIGQLRNGSLVEGYTPPGYPYVFDWPLPEHCPEIMREFVVPKYFANDFLQRIPRAYHVPYQDSWPSLFVGPAGSGSGLHIDSFGSSFWMGLVSGKKKWIVYPPDTSLEELYHNVTKNTYMVRPLFHLESEKYPLLREAHEKAKVFIQEAGDLVFIPGGTPHQVINLEDVIGASMNFVDGGNLELSRATSFAMKDKVHEGLAHALGDPGLETRVPSDARDLPFDLFKEFPLPTHLAGSPYDLDLNGDYDPTLALPQGEMAARVREYGRRVEVIESLLDPGAEVDAALAFAEWRETHIVKGTSAREGYGWLSRHEPETMTLLHVIMHRYAAALGLDPSEWSGAEWWIQTRSGLDPLHFHCDCAEGRKNGEANVHPLLSTVLYLTDSGGPTLVMDAELSHDADDDPLTFVPPSPQDGVLSYPARGRAIVFDGSLLHGVIEDKAEGSKETRVTLLMNFWRVRPTSCASVNWDDLYRNDKEAPTFLQPSAMDPFANTPPTPIVTERPSLPLVSLSSPDDYWISEASLTMFSADVWKLIQIRVPLHRDALTIRVHSEPGLFSEVVNNDG